MLGESGAPSQPGIEYFPLWTRIFMVDLTSVLVGCVLARSTFLATPRMESNKLGASFLAVVWGIGHTKN